MSRPQKLSRTLVAVLAISALVAPAAGARPLNLPASNAKHSVSAVRGTDVSAPDQQGPVLGQDRRSPDAVDATQPTRSAITAVRAPVQAGDGTPSSTIGLGLVGACLALAGSALTAGRIRRSRLPA